MATADRNLFVCYSPTGERFETTRPNFNDLTRHAGWYEHPPHPDTVAENIAKTSVSAETARQAEASAPADAAKAEREAAEATEREAENQRLREEAERRTREDAEDREAAGDEESEGGEANQRVLKLLPSDFADMDKPAVFSYIEKTFPGNSIDGRAGRDKLVAIAIELANAEQHG